MKQRLTQTFPLLLAAALQLLPLLRNIVTSPVTGSSFAFILRWGIGSAAALGGVEAVSGASAVFITPTNFTLTAGNYFSNSIVCSLVGTGNPAATSDGFYITNLLNTAQHSAFFANGQSTTNGLPSGLSCTCISLNGANYVYASVTGSNTVAGTYKCSFTAYSPGNAAITTNVFFTIVAGSTPPVITNQPAAATNIVGTANTLFSVTAGGSPVPAYQWYFNTNTALLNQTNALLTLNNIQLTNAGFYRCTITNSAGTTNSANALLTVWQPPILTNQPVALTNNVGTIASFSVTAGGTPTPAYQWYFNTNTLMAGQTAATLALNNVQLTNAGIYSVIATNSAGGTNSFYTQLTVWQPPVITNHPAGTAIVAGGAVTLNIVAGGTPTLNYQWKFNTNTVLTGANGATLSLANLRANQAGTYSVTVTNAAGVTNSFMAMLTITNPPPPALASTVNVSSGKFNFTFTPVPGLTNTVLTNGTLVGGNWGVFTNVPPPVSATPITLASPAGGGNLFYKLMIQP